MIFIISNHHVGASPHKYAAIASAEFAKLINYSYLNAKDSADFIEQRSLQLKMREKLQIPGHFHIPVELMSFRRAGEKRYFVKYNTGKDTRIAYIPSDLAIYYESEAWLHFRKYGKNAPLLSIILAQQYTESGFDSTQKGDNNQSIGLPQLYKPTAKWLMQVAKSKWDSIFNFDTSGNHYFLSVRAQVQFPFVFLPQYTRYSAENKFEGLRRYNGAGPHAIRYAQIIMKRSLFYADLFSQYNHLEIDSTIFTKQLFAVVNMGLQNKGYQALSDTKLDEIFSLVNTEYLSGMLWQQHNEQFFVKTPENKPFIIEKLTEYQIPYDGNRHFFIIEDGRTLFSYFNKVDEMIRVINHIDNDQFYCFYRENDDIYMIADYNQIKNRLVYSNTKAGDKIVLPPGSRIFSPDANIIIEMRN